MSRNISAKKNPAGNRSIYKSNPLNNKIIFTYSQ